MPRLTPREIALHAARLLSDKGGMDIRVMAMPPGSALMDYVVLASARSDRQANAMAEAVHRFAKDARIGHRAVEGETGWMLVDCLDVVVHVLSEEMRARYALDSLWKSARELVLDIELSKLPPFAASAAAEEPSAPSAAQEG
jgi:ribosome-associated protein